MAGVGDSNGNSSSSSSTGLAESSSRPNPLASPPTTLITGDVQANAEPEDLNARPPPRAGELGAAQSMDEGQQGPFGRTRRQHQEWNEQSTADIWSQPPTPQEDVEPNEHETRKKKDFGFVPDLLQWQHTNAIVNAPKALHKMEPHVEHAIVSSPSPLSMDKFADLHSNLPPHAMCQRGPSVTNWQRTPFLSESVSLPSLSPHNVYDGHQESSVLPFMKRKRLSLRCWFLCPLLVMFVVVTVVTMTLAVVTSNTSSESLSHSLHDVVLATMEASIGRLTLTKMARMAVATGNLYFSTNTFPNPQTDVLMPLEDGMMSRLCAVLRDMDPSDTVSSLGAVSLTRQQAALCVNSRSRPGAFLGAVSRNGTIDGFYFVDPVTLEFYTPLESLDTFDKPITIDEFTEAQRYGTVVNTWKETLRKGGDMKPAQYWVTPRNPPTNAAFVYPFFEVYSNGSTGIGYMCGTMFTDDLKSVKWYNATDSGMRVMLVDPNATAERLLVLTNNWGQPLSNVSNAWLAVVRGEPVDFMHVDEVDDTLMREALKHVDLRAAIGNTQGQNASFPYGGFDARVTAKPLVTESGVEFLLVVVTSRSYYLGPVSVYGDIGITAGVVALLLVTAACIAFVECCIMGPLRATQGELKLALTGAPVVAGNHPRAVLREVRELEDVCNTLRRRLDKVRSYMPDRLGAELVPTESYTAFGGSEASNAGSHGRVSDKLKRVACSVAYVYYTPRTTRNPTSTVMELIMRAVVEIATDCGGCFEVQRPDYCVISFGVRSRNKEFAAEAFQAVEFARRLCEMMTACAELTGLYRVIVESGAFLSGVVSGGGRSHFVLLCRNLHYRIGEFLPYAGVVASVTEETALLVRGRCRLLPFETVFLEATGEAYVRLHEVIGGDVGTTAWHDYEHCYSEAYDMMERGEYGSALRWWDRAKAVERGGLAGEPPECRSSQVERLREECVARVGRGDTTPFARRPRQARTEENEMPPSDAVSTVTGRDSVSTQTTSPTISFRRGAAMTSPVSETASLEVISGCLPLQFKDHAGNVWKRSLEPMGGTATDITPVYMAISATGTLAVLKVCPLTNACALLSRAGMDAALEELLGLGVNDSLVQYLSYCIVPSQSVVLVTQYVPGGTLREMKGRYGRKLPLPTVRRNVASMLRGLAHLHGRGLVHGRLCPENVMVGVDGRCRLKGMLLGVAPLIVHHESYYMSPEVAAGGVNTAENDMYALGLLLLAMLTDSHPWQWTANVQLDRTRAELDSLLADNTKFREALRNGLIEPVHPPVDVDDTMQDVLHACLCVNPEKRSSAADIMFSCNL